MPIMSSLAAASNQGVGAVKQTPPPVNIVVANPSANTYPFKAIAGRIVNMTYQHDLNANYDVNTVRRYVVSGFNGATNIGAAFAPSSFFVGNNTTNFFPNLLPALAGTYTNINLRYMYSTSASVASRIGNPSNYLTLTAGDAGASSFTATATSSSSINLSITAPSGTLNGCLIYQYNYNTGGMSLIFDYAVQGYFPTSWAVGGLTPNTSYDYYILYHYTAAATDTWSAIVITGATTPDAPVITAINFVGGSQVNIDWSNSTNPTLGFDISMALYVDLGSGYTYVGGSSTSEPGTFRSTALFLPSPYVAGGPTDGFVVVSVQNNNTGLSGSGSAYNMFSP